MSVAAAPTSKRRAAAANDAPSLPGSIIGLRRSDKTVTTIDIEASGQNWEQWFLLRSDAHHDNLHCQQNVEKRHLDDAKKRNAGILDFGDLFCAMQGKWDKRADPQQLRPELQTGQYLDELVRYNAAFYEEYAPWWLLMSLGNHETSMLRKHETNLTERLVERLNATTGASIQVGPYAGWVRFCFRRATQRTSRNLRFTHGYGGGGPVTRGVIQTNREAVYLGNADIVVSGHTHDQWEVPIVREVMLDSGRVERRTMLFLRLGGYKDEFSGGEGWAVERGHPPKPIGAYWIRFFFRDHQVQMEAMRAS